MFIVRMFIVVASSAAGLCTCVRIAGLTSIVQVVIACRFLVRLVGLFASGVCASWWLWTALACVLGGGEGGAGNADVMAKRERGGGATLIPLSSSMCSDL